MNFKRIVYRIASSLYDGGWRAEDAAELQQEYGLTDEELTIITDELEVLECMDGMKLEEEEF